MNYPFSASAKHVLLLAVFMFIGFAQVWGQEAKLNMPVQAVSESAALWKSEPFGKFDPSKEIIEKRDVSSKHFRNDDGSFTAHIAAGIVHYEENGQLKTIYHTIVPSGNGFENLTNNHQTYYPATSSGAIKTILKNGSVLNDMLGMRMYYESNGQAIQIQDIQNKQGKANYNELTYAGVYGIGIDLRLTQNTLQRKMDYIIQSRGALGNIPSGAQFIVFEETVELPSGWKANLKDNKILLADASGKTQALYDKPVFRDSPKHHHHDNEEREHDSDNERKVFGQYQISQNNNLVIIKTLVPISWLADAKRSFPLIIDPTMNCYVDNSDWHTGYVTSNGIIGATINADGNGQIDLGKWNNGNYFDHGWARFNVTNACTSSITSVNMFYNIGVNFTSDNVCRLPVHIRQVPISNNLVTATSADRLSFIRSGGSIYETRDFAERASGTGWRSTPLSNNLSILETATTIEGWVSVGFHNYANTTPHASCYNLIAGHTNANRPYLEINYNEKTCNLAQETTPLNTGPNGCTDGSFRVGSGAFFDVTVTPNSYYNFSWSNNAASNISGFCAAPQNGVGNSGSFNSNQTGWFSGTTNLLRVSASRSSCIWSATSAIMTYRHTEPAASAASGAGTYCYPANLTATGGTNGTFYWQNSAAGVAINLGSGNTKSVTQSGSWWVRSNNNGCWGAASAEQAVVIQAPPGAPTANNQWNVFCFSGSNFDYISGYYTENNLTFNTASRWINTPSDANNASGSAYSGCPLPVDYHSYKYNRKGFDCRQYQINVGAHDDGIRVFIDVNDNGIIDAGDLDWSDPLCCNPASNIWTGFLTSNSRVIVEVKEIEGASYSSVEFVDVTPTISLTLPAANCINTSFNLSATSGYATYQWSGSGISSTNTSSTNTNAAVPTSSGSQAYAVTVTNSLGCQISTSNTILINTSPIPTFALPTSTTPNPAAQVCKDQNVVYTTQTGGGINNYSWTIQGSSGNTYNIVAGNTNSNSVTLQWLTTGDKTVTVNYSDNNSCVGANPASNTQNVTFPVAPTLHSKSP